jgi:hypothetical protein
MELLSLGSGLANAISVGVRLTWPEVELGDTIVAYSHCGLLAFNILLTAHRRPLNTSLFVSNLLGILLPNQLIFLRPFSLLLLPILFSSKPVIALTRRTLPLLGWTLLVMFCLVCILVLLLVDFFQFGDSATWLFVKPWEAIPYEYFDVRKHSGSSV